MRGPRDRTYWGYLMRENPWLQLQGGGTSYSMSAMPPWRPNSVAQRNDTLCQTRTFRFGTATWISVSHRCEIA